MKKAFLILMSLTILAGCSFLQERLAVKNCKFSFVSARPMLSVTDMLQRRLRVKLRIRIKNPNKGKATIDNLDLMLYLEGRKTVTASFPGVSIPAGGIRTVSSTVTVPFSAAGNAVVATVKKKGQIRYRLAGKVYVKTPLGKTSFQVDIAKSD